MHMMMSMRLNTCMETIRKNNSWNISRSVVVDDAKMLVIVCTENMEWLHEQGCSEYMQTMVKVHIYVYYNLKKTDNVVCNSMCT